MYVVTVLFVPRPGRAADLREALLANARASREGERGCRQFDVCVEPGSGSIFLYELYDDRAAFDAHLASAHFRAFDAQVRDWVASKDVRVFERVDPAPHATHRP
jgi:quinol monooxygenase YgiN